MQEEEVIPKDIDLCEKTGERKYLKASADQYANTLLRERKAYVLTKVFKGENEEQIV
jgi:hypothetical protein